MTKRLLAAAGMVLALLLASAVPASAATRLAAPGAIGANPCNPAPCGLALAVSGAKDGDQVVLAAGTYELPSDLTIGKAISVGGVAGAPANLVLKGNTSVRVDNAGAVFHDARVSLAEPAMAYPLVQEKGTTERVYADGANGADACHLASGTLRDSVCFHGLTVAPGDPGSYQASIRNVTADPISFGAHGDASLTATVVNTAALPGLGMGANAEALLINSSAGSSTSVVLTNSSYNGVDTSLSSGKDFSFTPAGTNGNQIVAPHFVNAAAGDFRQLPSSPTIDAGIAELLLGPLDLGGALRSQPRCIGGTPVPDIGANEFAPTEPCPGGGSGGEAPPPPGKANSDLPPKPPKLGKLRRNPARGTATLPVEVTAAGTVTLSGKGVVRRQLRAKGPGTLRLLVKAKGRKAEKLRSEGEAKLVATIAFDARAGYRTVITRALKLKLRPAA